MVDDVRATGVDLSLCELKSRRFLTGAGRLWRVVSATRPRIIQGWMYHGNLAAQLAHNLCPGRHKRKLFWNLRASNMDVNRYDRIIRWSARLSQQVDVVVANSEAGIVFHRKYGFRPRRFEMISNGVDVEKFRPDASARMHVRAELGLADEAVVALHVARTDPMKDHANFLAAMAQLPSVTGVMVGAGTRDLNAPANVHALGRRRDTARLYAGADIVVSSSAFGEGFSNVVAEGMSAGLVPVATDVGDSGRIVGETGWVVGPHDLGALAKAIGAAASLPPAERRNRGLRARERISALFTLDNATDAFARLYAEA